MNSAEEDISLCAARVYVKLNQYLTDGVMWYHNEALSELQVVKLQETKTEMGIRDTQMFPKYKNSTKQPLYEGMSPGSVNKVFTIHPIFQH